jgi:hypothetical protein
MAINTTTPFGIIKVNAANFPATKVEGSLYIWKGGAYVATSTTEAELLGQITYAASLASVSDPVQGRLYIPADTKTIHRWTGSGWEQIAVPPTVGTVENAERLSNAQNFSITGKATAANVSFNGEAAVALNVTSLDATGLTGAVPAGVITSSSLVTTSALSTELDDYYTSAEVDSKLTSAMTYKGTKATYAELPSAGNSVGDVWNVTTGADGAGHNYAWDGTAWDQLGGVVSLANYVTLDGTQTISGSKTFSSTITGTITAAQALSTARNFSVTGKATAAAISFDGSGNVALDVTSLDATGLTGAIPSAVTATTQAASDNSTKIATTAYVTSAVDTAKTKWTVVN